MSKYEPLWIYLSTRPDAHITLTVDRVAEITGFKFDHAFLTFKRELPAYGGRFETLSLKNQTVSFVRNQ